MTPDSSRGSFHCRAGPGAKLSYMILVGSRVKHVWSSRGGGRGFFIWAVPGAKLSYMLLVGSRAEYVWSGCGGGPANSYHPRIRPDWSRPSDRCAERSMPVPYSWCQKYGPEKSDPTPLSYHSRVRPSTPKWAYVCKICILHKSECAHLGNIPS